MSKLLQAGMTACAAILLAAMLTTPAAARIQCHGNFQMTNYGPIATPYCEEEQIAFVARSYGQRVTAAEVHNNPLTKVSGMPVCRRPRCPKSPRPRSALSNRRREDPGWVIGGVRRRK